MHTVKEHYLLSRENTAVGGLPSCVSKTADNLPRLGTGGNPCAGKAYRGRADGRANDYRMVESITCFGREIHTLGLALPAVCSRMLTPSPVRGAGESRQDPSHQRSAMKGVITTNFE